MDHQNSTNSRKSIPIEEGDEKACVALWRGVVIQALMDAKIKKEKDAPNAAARAWLAGLSEDFSTVCDLADLNQSQVIAIAKATIHGHWSEDSVPIDFRCLRKGVQTQKKSESRGDYFARAKKNARYRREKRLGSKESPRQENATSNFQGLFDFKTKAG